MEALKSTLPTPPVWQRELAQAIRDPAELLALLGLDAASAGLGEAGNFPLRVPRAFAARMRPGDANDPLLRQVLPVTREAEAVPGFVADPVGDRAARTAPGLLRKYPGRALLVTTGACAVHCRYCFRRHYPYGEVNPAAGQWQAALAHLAADTEVEEVILSGGDPLALPDERLAALADALGDIPHLKRLRIHTRLPVVLPSRIDAALLRWLRRCPLPVVMVVHANHPAELDAATTDALRRLAGSVAALLNQAVLLRGVNDSAKTLAALSEALFDAGVLPYYLHLLDRVNGAAHFEVPREAARRIGEDLRARLPGYLVPRLVWEEPGAPYKRPL